MSTIRQQIRDAAIAALNTSPPTGVPETTKRRFIPGEKITQPRIAAFFSDEDDQRVGGAGGPLTKRRLIIAIQAIVPVELPDEADDAIEPLLAHIVDVLGDTNLGGLATNVSEIQTVWATANDAGVFIIVALTRWGVEFQTVRDDLTKRS